MNLFGFQIEFIKDLLREHIGSKHSDIDTICMAQDILEIINAQHPDVVYEVSLRTGELIEIPVE